MIIDTIEKPFLNIIPKEAFHIIYNDNDNYTIIYFNDINNIENYDDIFLKINELSYYSKITIA